MSTATGSAGWIGLGSMGLAMAINIQKHLKATGQPNLKYWNRTISKGEELQALGGEPCTKPTDVALNCEITFISVSDDHALEHIASEIATLGASLAGEIIVDTTTVHPFTTTAVATQLEQLGAIYIAAPVFGSTPVAQAGQLLVAVAGPDDAIAAIEPLLTGVIARGVLRVGTDPAQALLLKTTSNMLTAGLMYLIAEAHTLAEKSGLPSSVLEALIEQNLGSYAHGVSKRITGGAYLPAEGQAPQSGLELGITAVQHGIDLAKSNGMPRLDVAESYVGAAKEAKAWSTEHGRALDSSSVFGIVRERAGLEFENDVVKERDI
ncbi:6-phosphogluconate dehydrogenase-like protein NAD-binding protein [Boeremia exigua]|uniref:6-phosphogluconate dehydrogenase-like protein NAD-binding protein n=1 Tax=Boeremia exigua TaxID=749465 RepID=UPI001E8CAD5F|nr:6-phosphogluconate dehydrogenase-like protein NAD-binding protein [Boeremia exigua]KAH6615030.1 6-phosphogluconate dehydrogenase-like protein NAD-binding protein [Boeremia exigua]